MKKRLIPIGLALLAASVARADFDPIPLTAGSYTVDAVVEKTAVFPLVTFTTATMDGGTNNDSQTWYEAGVDFIKPTTGFPAAGSTFIAQGSSTRTFRMPPRYDQPNALLLTTNGHPTATLTFPTPVTAASVSLLHAVSGGATTLAYTINFQGGTTESGTVNLIDWFNTSEPNLALIAKGRINVGNAQLSEYLDNPRLFYADISVGASGTPITSITFTTPNANRAAIFGVSTSTDFSTYTPVTVGGFNRDMVVENSPNVIVSGSLLTKCNVIMDDGATALRGNTWYEIGFNRGATNTGIPAAGTVITRTNAGVVRSFSMPTSYAQDCVMYIGNYAGYTTGTLTLQNPRTVTSLSFLNGAGNGPVNMNLTIYHSDGQTEQATLASPDWFNSAGRFYTAAGRFNPQSLALNNVNETNPGLAATDVPVTISSPVTKVEFSYTSGGRAMIFAVSGQNGAGAEFLPFTLSGFNADGVVEASAERYPFPLKTATTASMDGGTNNTANTWFEQGFNPNRPLAGLPAPGSLLNSQALPDHHYRMASSYTANNAIFVDATITNANLTLATPATYSGLSFLSSSANGRVTNYVIMQYQDGSQETNYFTSLDWFGGTPYAFTSSGRYDLNTRTFNTLGGTDPRLYEAQFALGNTTSKLTNMVLGYLAGQGASSRMFVFAVSGTAGAVPPILGSVTPGSSLVMEGTNVTFTTTLTGGTEPITLQWQKQDGANWVNVTDGGNISGASTLSLTITGVTVANAGTYRVSGSNAAGPGVSGLGTLAVRSAMADVTKPGDPVSIISGSVGGGAEGVASSINNTIQKWLNFDADAAGPFVGPVGLIVSPSIGKTVVSGLRIYTANDAEGRDPADFTLEGSNDGGQTWTQIATSALALPGGRNTQAGTTAIDPMTMNLQEVLFANTANYSSYRLTFNTVKDANSNCMQIGEVEFLGVVAPIPAQIVRNLPATVTTYAGSSPRLSVDVVGAGPITYQWYRGATAISGATSAGYTIPPVQLADSGATFKVRITNPHGFVDSVVTTLNVIGAPTQPYPAAVLADKPMSFWRLSEPDNASGNTGVVAKDAISGNNGQYNNVMLGVTGYNPTADTDTAAQFGSWATTDSYVGNIQGVNFASPAGTPAAFTVEAWINGNAQLQTFDAGIVTKGYGGGGEQFNLDLGTENGAARGPRFFVRNATGGTHGANATNDFNYDAGWHHLVGVCDQVNGKIILYVDGKPAGTGSIPVDAGILSSSTPVSIGSRQPGANSAFSEQFYGNIDDVAVYNYALSPEQVLSHYYGGQFGPKVLVDAQNISANEGGTATFTVNAYGAPALGYQWYDVSAGDPGTLLPGQTSSNLVINPVTAAHNGKQYRVVITNPYGTVTSPNAASVGATLTVIGGAPTITTDLPAGVFVYSGRTLTLSVAATGTEPMTYVWKSNGVTIVNGGRISGAQTATLTIANAQQGDSANYQVFVSNSQGGPVASTVAAVIVDGTVAFNGGAGWKQNGSAGITNEVLTLTTTGNQASSAFLQYPLYVGAFRASFTYQDIGGGGADGIAFVLQNDSRGTSALGGGGGSLGYSGIAPSAGLLFNIYGTAGMSFKLNGATGNYVSTAPVDIANGNAINIVVEYASGVAQITLTDTSSGSTYTTNLNVGSLPAAVGAQTAYVGFTGASGGIASHQIVSNFQYVPKPALAGLVSAPNTLLLAWPASVGGFTLYQSSTLEAGSWTPVTSAQTIVGDEVQTSISTTTGNKYFRLAMPE